MSHYEKYLKYKLKYFDLKNNQHGGAKTKSRNNQYGGNISRELFTAESIVHDFTKGAHEKEDNLIGWNIIKITDKFRDLNEFIIYEKVLNDKDESKPNLFIMSGFSVLSVKECIGVVKDVLDLLSTKYKAVYIMNLTSFKKAQNDDIALRDKDPKANIPKIEDFESLEKYKAHIKSDAFREARNEIEMNLNIEIGKTVHSLIKKLKLDNIHLLGKSAGGGLAISMLNEYVPSFTALFLAVPASPTNVRKLHPDVLKNCKLRFSWNVADVYTFDWHKIDGEGGISADEKAIYDKQMYKYQNVDKIKINYISFMFSTDYKTTNPPYRNPEHEINRKFIEFICMEKD